MPKPASKTGTLQEQMLLAAKGASGETAGQAGETGKTGGRSKTNKSGKTSDSSGSTSSLPTSAGLRSNVEPGLQQNKVLCRTSESPIFKMQPSISSQTAL